jgi:biotin transport system substrate-specific component
MARVSSDRSIGRVASFSLREMMTAALLAGLLCVSAWVSIPATPVPLTLQVFFVLLAGLLLRPPVAGMALLVYLLLGVAGLPVFSSARGGAAILFGPTGGYLWGFLLAAVTVALLRDISLRQPATGKASPFGRDLLAACAGLAVLYLAGWLQLMAITGLNPWGAILVGVLPFLGLDLVKAFLAVLAARLLRRVTPVHQEN